jgi:hypothetical protein
MAYVARISVDTEKISCYSGKDVSLAPSRLFAGLLFLYLHRVFA